ncbi:hypothetical protein H632_c211p3 [Helicosporidium sp. ATCC 50920]|nr:hypothetical protein H632_c211p3 [Helicosporidium sp. ATCC 50920]|eukprot:KDD76482.1 hypothetical protein H632_c211p3 [Helicosporidium sp. ATCC 50920]
MSALAAELLDVTSSLSSTSATSSTSCDSERPSTTVAPPKGARLAPAARRTLVASSSSSEEDVPEEKTPASGEGGARLRRLVRGKREGAGSEAAENALDASSDVERRPSKAAKTRRTALHRIQRAQARWLGNEGDATSEEEESERTENESASALLAALSASSEEADSSATDGGSTCSKTDDDSRTSSAREDSPSTALDPAPSRHSALARASFEDRFAVYVEYLVLCLADPGYPATVQASPKHLAYYLAASRALDWSLLRAAEAAASDAWRCSRRGILEAVEKLPGWRVSQRDPGEAEGEVEECDACGKCRARCSVALELSGRALRVPPPHGNLFRRLALGSETFAANNFSEADETWLETDRGATPRAAGRSASFEHDVLEQPSRPRRGTKRVVKEYILGATCAGRLALYHAIMHWPDCLLSRLRRELKYAKQVVRGRGQGDQMCLGHGMIIHSCLHMSANRSNAKAASKRLKICLRLPQTW